MPPQGQPGTPVQPGHKFDNEYECGARNEPHFHWYDDRNFIGHFKIRDVRIRIPNMVGDRRARCCDARLAMGAVGAQSAPGSRRIWPNNGITLCYRCMWALWKQNNICGKYKRENCNRLG